MLRADDVSKSFGRLRALDRANMTVPSGAIYGMVGVNGSGKTTMLRHIAGILRPDSGEISADDMPVYDNNIFKERMIFIPDELYFHGNTDLKGMAAIYRRFYPRWDEERFVRIADRFGLDRKARITRFSKGMQKQATFTLAMAAAPDYLILDEPVDGLDPLTRRTVWDLIVNDVAERRMTVLISSHNLKEIEGICDTVGILSRGRVVLESEVDSLRSNVHKVQAAYDDRPEDPYVGLNVLSLTRSGSMDLVIIRNTMEEIEAALDRHHPSVLDILPLTLEEIFIYELGGEKDEFKDILG